MKAFKKLTTAVKAAGGLPIIAVRNGKDALYIIAGETLLDVKLAEVTLITPTGGHAGYITMEHLNRLGNANWAEAKKRLGATSVDFAEGGER